jgi:hypothetical protein
VAWPQIADVDDADLDTELVDALRDLSSMQDDVQQRRLDRIEGLPEAQLKPALRALLNSLSTEQLDELAATSSEEEEEDDDAEDESGGGSGDGAVRGGRAAHPPPGMRVVALDTARRRCFKGPELSAMLMRPPDYAGEGGPEEFVCDVCGAENYPPFLFQRRGPTSVPSPSWQKDVRPQNKNMAFSAGIEDQRYVDGVYHCSDCGDWDGCVSCVGCASYQHITQIPAAVRAIPTSGGGGGGGGGRDVGQQQQQQKVRRRRKGGSGKKHPGGRRGKRR